MGLGTVAGDLYTDIDELCTGQGRSDIDIGSTTVFLGFQLGNNWLVGNILPKTPNINISYHAKHKMAHNTCNKNAVYFTWDEIMPNNQQKTWTIYAGFKDWRVPTSKELLTLVRCSNGTAADIASRASCSGKGWGVDINSYHSPTIDTSIFTNAPNGTFWTASHHETVSKAAWVVDFRSGLESWEYCNVTKYVRLVRTNPQLLDGLKLPTIPK